MKNLIDRITTREAWSVINAALQKEIAEVCGKDSRLALELAGFKSDLNIALHQKFGIQETK